MNELKDINGTWAAKYYSFAAIFAVSAFVVFYLPRVTLFLPFGLALIAFAATETKKRIDKRRITPEPNLQTTSALRKTSIALAFISAAANGVLGACVSVFAYKAVQG